MRVWPRCCASRATKSSPCAASRYRIRALPAGSQVTVTASPALGLSRTVDAAVLLAASGHHVTAHLAARMLRGRRELAALVERLADAGIGEACVIGGDASPPAGPYRDAADLLDELAGLGHPFTRIGVGAYPEGHPLVTDEALLEALRRKQAQADYLVTSSASTAPPSPPGSAPCAPEA